MRNFSHFITSPNQSGVGLRLVLGLVWTGLNRLVTISLSRNPYQKHRGRIRFEFEMVFEWPIFGLFSNQIEYFIRTVIMYVYIDSPSQTRRTVRDST
jgi:hypothetical protein